MASEWPEPYSPHLPKCKPQPTVKCLEDPNCAFKYGGYTQINTNYGKLVHFTAEHYVCRWQGHGEFPLSSVAHPCFLNVYNNHATPLIRGKNQYKLLKEKEKKI